MNFVYCNPLYFESGHFFLYFCLSEIKSDVPGEEILPQPQEMAVTMCCSMSFQADCFYWLLIDVMCALNCSLICIVSPGMDRLALGKTNWSLEIHSQTWKARQTEFQDHKRAKSTHGSSGLTPVIFPPQDDTSQRMLGNNDKAALTWWRGEMPCCGWPDGNVNNRQINSANKTYG